MSVRGEAFSADRLLLLTLTGQVTVHFMDGYTLEGELIKQDLFNFYLLIDNQPRMISRSQVRYIAGVSGQEIGLDIASQEALLEAEAVQIDTGKAGDIFDTAAVAPPLPVDSDQFEPVAAEADREILADKEGTFVVQPEAAQPILDMMAEMSAPEPVDQLDDTGVTFVLPDSADVLTELEKIPDADEWDDATMVLDQEDDDENEITAVFSEEAEETVRARLVCSTGPHAGDQFKLEGEAITLGRAKDNGIALFLDKEISRRHAMIRLEAGQFVIQDQNSLNGTFVNSERVNAPRILQDGDVIFVGVSDLTYQEE